MAVPTLRAGDVVRIRDARWTVARQTQYDAAAILDVVGSDGDNRGVRAFFLLPFEPVDRLPSSAVPRVARPRRWARMAREVVASATPSYQALRVPMRAAFAVFPFQLEPALAVMSGVGSRVLIADDVGLGKTVQAGLIVAESLLRCPRDGHALIVCPASLRHQWQSELRERFALESTVVHAGALVHSPGMEDGANPWSAHPVVITSIDYVKRPEVMRSLEALIWDVVVFDEAHALSGRSDRSQAAAALADRSRTLVMLTATPHSGEDEAFTRLCAVGDLGGGFPLVAFRRTRQDVGLSMTRRTIWSRVRPTMAETRMHEALMAYARLVWRQNGMQAAGARLAMAVLARRACSSAASLARSVERRLAMLVGAESTDAQLTLPFDATGDDDGEPLAQLAAPGLNDRAEEHERLEHLLVLATDAARAESKIRALLRLLRRAQQPAIVFTEYRDTLVHLAAALSHFAPAQLHGGLSTAERQEVVHQFTAGGAPLLLATDAASEGLNLHQRCRLVINLELPWSPIRLEQRVGRVERIGQRLRVHAVHLVASGTSEESTVATLCRRMGRASQALDAMRGPAVSDTDIMRSVLEHTDVPAVVRVDTFRMPPDVVVPDLRSAASAEAARIAGARAMAVGARTPRAGAISRRWEASPGRPWVAVFRRRNHPTHCCWAFQLEFVDARHRMVWETLLGLMGTPAFLPGRSAAEVRRWFDVSEAACSALVGRHHHLLLAEVQSSVEAPRAAAVRREQAIVGALRERRARIAATLLQPGLFDSRAERVAAAQTAVMDEALARCTARLADLASRGSLLAANCDLVLAAILGR